MTWKQIERSREARLWISQVIVPVALILSVPEVRTTIKEKTTKMKESITSKIKRK